jgi:microsomal epoxide hydrolase
VLAHRFPQRLQGIHINLLPVGRHPAMLADPNAEEKKYLDQLNNFQKEETGYQWIQGTRPQTLAFGLTDSPAGLAAWIVEKFRAWTDNQGNPEEAVSRDEMLANISLYWFTGTIGSSFWPYYERMHGARPIPNGAQVMVPMGYAEFPRDVLSPPRSLAARTFTDIRRWTRMPKGGHFAALEQPELLSADIIAFFAGLG